MERTLGAFWKGGLLSARRKGDARAEAAPPPPLLVKTRLEFLRRQADRAPPTPPTASAGFPRTRARERARGRLTKQCHSPQTLARAAMTATNGSIAWQRMIMMAGYPPGWGSWGVMGPSERQGEHRTGSQVCWAALGIVCGGRQRVVALLRVCVCAAIHRRRRTANKVMNARLSAPEPRRPHLHG